MVGSSAASVVLGVYGSLVGYRWSIVGTKVSLIVRAEVHRMGFCAEPALSFVPEARPALVGDFPPLGQAVVHLSTAGPSYCPRQLPGATSAMRRPTRTCDQRTLWAGPARYHRGADQQCVRTLGDSGGLTRERDALGARRPSTLRH